MTSKGKLPVTGFMILESEEESWRLLTRQLTNQLKTTAKIEIEPGREVRISLVIDFILPPERQVTKNTCNVKSDLERETIIGFERTREFLSNYFDRKRWMFKGYIDGENKIPIFIIYYEILGKTIYTQKLTSESESNFFSQAMLN